MPNNAAFEAQTSKVAQTLYNIMQKYDPAFTSNTAPLSRTALLSHTINALLNEIENYLQSLDIQMKELTINAH